MRSAEISCRPHTSLDEINDSVVRSERGELCRGSDLPLMYRAHTTAGDVWRVPTRLPARNAFGGWCVKPRDKHARSSPNGQKNNHIFFLLSFSPHNDGTAISSAKLQNKKLRIFFGSTIDLPSLNGGFKVSFFFCQELPK